MATNAEFEQLLIDGTDLLERSQMDQAMSKAMEALSHRPGNPLAENLLGLALFARRRFREARDIFEGLVRRHPDVASLRINAGLTALRTDGINRAKAHFERVIQLEPDHRRALAYLALLSFKSGDRVKTRALLQRADLDELATRMSQPLDDEATLWLALDIESRADQLTPGRGSGPLPPRAHEGFAEVLPLVPEESWDNRTSKERHEVRLTTRVPPAELLPRPRVTTQTRRRRMTTGRMRRESSAMTRRLETGPPRPMDTRQRMETGPPRRAHDTGPPEPVVVRRRASRINRRPTRRQTSPLWPLSSPNELVDRGPRRARRSSANFPIDAPWRLDDLLLDDGDAGPAAEVIGGLLVLRVGLMSQDEDTEAAYLRWDQLILQQGTLDFAGVQRRRMGQDRGAFEPDGQKVLQASGDGRMVMQPGPGKRFELLNLKEDTLFVREDALAAFSSELFWENGHIPGVGTSGPGVVLFRGTGFVSLAMPNMVQAIEVHRTAPVSVRLSHLLGWTAEVVPQLRKDHPGSEDEVLINCAGPGMVLIDFRLPPIPGVVGA